MVEPAGRVQARTDGEAYVLGVDVRRVDAGRPHEREQPLRRRSAKVLKPPPDDEPVLAKQRRHVRDGADRRKLHETLRPSGPPLRFEQRLRQLERHADPGQVVEPVAGVRRVGVDHRGSLREAAAHQVVVGYHGVYPQRARVGDGGDVAHAAVHGHDKPDALGGEGVDGCIVEAVSLAHPVGDVGDHVQAVLGEGLHHQRRSRHAVGVEVPVHRRRLAAVARLRDAGGCGVHVGKGRGVFEQAVGRAEELLRLAPGPDAALVQEVRDQRGHAVHGLDRVGRGRRGHRPPAKLSEQAGRRGGLLLHGASLRGEMVGLTNRSWRRPVKRCARRTRGCCS